MLPLRRLACSVLLLTALAAPAAPPEAAPAAAVARPGIAEGQNHADYLAWLARSPAARAQVLGFKSFLEIKGFENVVPTWQLLRTASMWRECNGPRFEVPSFVEWPHISNTLRFIDRHVEPVIGEVEVVSGFRNAELNRCSGGARESAHRRFHALDLVPVRDIGRDGMIRSICAIHNFRGRDYDIGLGFYSGARFHIDSKSFRKWGPDGKGATSPCNA
jgi:hypothetical protein